jgi:putative DNA primase/helicase
MERRPNRDIRRQSYGLRRQRHHGAVPEPCVASVLGFDVFKQQIVALAKPPIPNTQPGQWLGHYDIATADWLQREGIPVAPLTAGQAIAHAAHRNEFHPVRDYLASLAWDRVPRIDTFAITCLGAEDTPYHRAVGARFFIGLVRRIKEPGCKLNCAIILEGPQGQGKSSALAALMPNRSWFGDELAEMGTKDAALQLNGKWLVELS